jgi:uncharacterized protein
MTKRILSIDGGGIRGILPLTLLTAIEARRGPCADLFDMVAGTSIGGTIATGLAHRVPARTIHDMLMGDGGTIFAKTLVTNVLNAVQPKLMLRRWKVSLRRPSRAPCSTASTSRS